MPGSPPRLPAYLVMWPGVVVTATCSGGRSSGPTKQSYGVDLGFRDPFGNPIRIGQTS